MILARRNRSFLFYPFIGVFLVLLYYGFSHWHNLEEIVNPEITTPPLPPVHKPEQILVAPSMILSVSESSSTIATLSTPSPEIVNPSHIPDQNPKVHADASDILLIFKTGASTLWRRMPLHITTTLANSRVPNSVVYSDISEYLSDGLQTIDALSNVTSLLQEYDASAYARYLELHSHSHINTYLEHAQLPGDEPQVTLDGNHPDWNLDKFKFLPMLTHAQSNWPDLKWYIYIEDDTYIFLDNVLSWLANLSPDDPPSYYGAYSGTGNETFAQGGSGIAFSRSLMRTIFGATPDIIPNLQKYGNLTATGCCGDMILGEVLRDYGVYVNQGGYGSVSWRPEPPWKTGFDERMWCAPVFTFHHLHQRDLAQLSQLERKHTQEGSNKPILFRDIYIKLISPHMTESSFSNWDSFASKYVLNENSTSLDVGSEVIIDKAIGYAYLSPTYCSAACIAVQTCMSWRYDATESICGLDVVVKLGRELDPPKWEVKHEVVSGWMLERIEQRLIGNMCNVVTSE